MQPRKTPSRRRYTAAGADRHVLYQRSVQSPDVDVEFFSRRFHSYTGRPLRRFREDFCGTALLSCEFVRLHRDNRALGVDLHRPTLDWGRRHNLSQLSEEQRRRVVLRNRNVLAVHRPLAELTAAMNFSYWVFRTRPDLLRYFRSARRSLVEGGLLLVDAFGGGEAQIVQEERSRCGGFTYVWDQAAFDPVTHEIVCRIHYEFPDGTSRRNAFTYHWRLWTLPEIQELMGEAGFRDVHVLWEGTDRATNEGNNVFRRARRAPADPAWVAYVVGRA